MKKSILILFLLISVAANSQHRVKYLYAEISDKSVSLTPFYKVFGSSFDPALTIGGGIDYFQRGNSSVFHVVEGTAYSTKMIGNGLTLSTSIGYRYSLKMGLFAEIMLGIGGSGFFSTRETFSLDDNGQYQTVNPAHLIVGVPIDMATGYKSGRYSIYLKYRYMIEGTYTDILPMLPTSLIGCGLRYDLGTK